MNTITGHNYNGPTWSPYLKWDNKDDDEENENNDQIYDDYSDPYGGH
mgnify:FL=1